MSKANDLTGRTFGLLKVLRRVEDVKPGRPRMPLREKYREILHQSYEAERCQVLRLSAASKITRTD